ncbi:inositol phospholipid synthesis and fat-storage-inducing TM-domain-containing protein [Morchella snyderi]|nr:inositol phospholipid synthesis and fat-storage-inducing TM-domain-containing protein [Morchella snyderi]
MHTMDSPPPDFSREKHNSNGHNAHYAHNAHNALHNAPNSTTAAPSSPTPAYHSLIPTGAGLIAAALYPTTLLAGSLYSILSPDAAATHSYFSHKSNLANTLLVKNGWLWTTLVFAVHAARLRGPSRPQALLRWALATLWWIAVTQWFFGAPIMDRTFTFTGGACRAVMSSDPGAGVAAVQEVLGERVIAATSAACKLAGGRWRGGHDLSGHTFLLTHASLFLVSEVMPVLRREGWWGWGRATACVAGLLAVWWWMLLMTGVYFHTWREKLTGWIVSMVQWSIVYVWALKTQPQIRDIVGVPSV